MSDIYAEHFANLKKAKPPYDIFEARKRMSRPLEDENGDLYGYTRTAENELDVLFARMPNPTLVMFIYPHLSGSNESPVPGYSTSFSMYEKVHYALPGEYPGILGYQ